METETLKTELGFYFAYFSYIKVMYPEAHGKATDWAETDKMVMNPKNFGLMIALYVVGSAMLIATFYISIGLLILIC
jgi:hypothetical protein